MAKFKVGDTAFVFDDWDSPYDGRGGKVVKVDRYVHVKFPDGNVAQFSEDELTKTTNAVRNAVDEAGRPLRQENIQGFKDADGKLIKVGDMLEDAVGTTKGQRSKVVGFKGTQIYLDSGWKISKSNAALTRIVNSRSRNAVVQKALNATATNGKYEFGKSRLKPSAVEDSLGKTLKVGDKVTDWKGNSGVVVDLGIWAGNRTVVYKTPNGVMMRNGLWVTKGDRFVKANANLMVRNKTVVNFGFLDTVMRLMKEDDPARRIAKVFRMRGGVKSAGGNKWKFPYPQMGVLGAAEYAVKQIGGSIKRLGKEDGVDIAELTGPLHDALSANADTSVLRETAVNGNFQRGDKVRIKSRSNAFFGETGGGKKQEGKNVHVTMDERGVESLVWADDLEPVANSSMTSGVFDGAYVVERTSRDGKFKVYIVNPPNKKPLAEFATREEADRFVADREKKQSSGVRSTNAVVAKALNARRVAKNFTPQSEFQVGDVVRFRDSVRSVPHDETYTVVKVSGNNITIKGGRDNGTSVEFKNNLEIA